MMRSGPYARRQWTLLGFGIAAVALTAVIVIVPQQTEQSESTTSAANAADLAAAANERSGADPELGLLLAIEAVEATRRVDGTVLDVAMEALHRAVLADRLLARVTHDREGFASFSPDGRTFVAPSDIDSNPKVWNIDPLEPRLELQGHTDVVVDAVYNRTGDRIATASFDNTVRIWDAATGSSLSELRVGDRSAQVAPLFPVFSNDGSKLAITLTDASVGLWAVDGGELIWLSPPLPGGGLRSHHAEFNSDDSELVVSLGAREPEDGIGSFILDVETGETMGRLGEHSADVTDVAFTYDGSQVLTASLDSTVKIRNVASGDVLGVFDEHHGPILDLDISDDGQRVASAGEEDVLVWDLSTFQVLAEIPGHAGQAEDTDISGDGTLLLTSSNTDFATRLWDLSPYWSHEQLGLPGPEASPGALAYSPNGEVLAAIRTPSSITLWHASTGDELRTLDVGAAVTRMDFDESGQLLATAGEGGVVLHDLRGGEDVVLSKEPVNDIAFGPGGALAAASLKGGWIWEAPAREGEVTFVREMTSSVAFKRDGSELAVGGGFGAEILEPNGRVLRDLHPPQAAPLVRSLDFHRERPLLAAAGNDTDVIVWSTETYEPLFRLEGHTSELGEVAFHPALPELAAAGDEAIVKFWDVDSGALRMSIPAPGPVSDLAYSPDGRYLAVTGSDGFVTTYILDVKELVSEAQRRLPRWWTEAECIQYLEADACPPASDQLRSVGGS